MLIREQVRDVLGPEKSDREQIGSLGSDALTADNDGDELAYHLEDEGDLDLDDFFGPVPPIAEEPYATSDPYARDTSVLPTSTCKRG